MRWLIGLIIFLSLFSTSFAGAIPFKTILSNGLTVIIQEKHAVPVVSTRLFYKVGSRNEAVGKSGRVHFIEHMLFKGTARYKKGEIDRIARRRGGSINAITTLDYTAFVFNLLSKDLSVALDIEADRMRNCAFDPAEIESERKVIMQERMRDMDSPLMVLNEETQKRAFTVHPYRNLILGELEDLKSVTRKELMAFYDQFYQPNNALLVVVGDVKADEALKIIKEKFDRIPRGPDSPRLRMQEPRQRKERRFMIKHEVAFPVIQIAFHSPPDDTRENYALLVLDNILTNGESSRLYKKLVIDFPIFNEVESIYYETIDPFLFAVTAELREGVGRREAESALIKEMEGLKETPLSDHELEKAKNQIEAEFIFSQQSAEEMAEKLGEEEVLFGWERLQRYVKEVRAVTKENIQRLARKYLSKENRTVGWLLPRAKSWR